MTIQGVIFDMDGLLIDSEPLWRNAEVKVFTGLGSEHTHAECAETMGMRLDEAIKYWHKKKNWQTERTLQQIADLVVDELIAQVRAVGKPREGASEVAELFHKHGVRMCVASSSSSRIMSEVMKKLDFAKHFEFCHSAEHEPAGKPHPAVYLSAIKKLNLPASACLAFEDSPNGVRSAKAAGLRCIAVPDDMIPTESVKAAGADLVLPSLKNFTEEVFKGLE